MIRRTIEPSGCSEFISIDSIALFSGSLASSKLFGATLASTKLVAATPSFQFAPTAPEPRLAVRAWRFWNVAWLAARIYAGYKAIQLWSRYISSASKEERYRRQDLRAARALRRASLRLEGLLIKASQFIATRADILPDEWVSTLSSLHDRVPPRPFETIRAQVERELG